MMRYTRTNRPYFRLDEDVSIRFNARAPATAAKFDLTRQWHPWDDDGDKREETKIDWCKSVDG